MTTTFKNLTRKKVRLMMAKTTNEADGTVTEQVTVWIVLHVTPHIDDEGDAGITVFGSCGDAWSYAAHVVIDLLQQHDLMDDPIDDFLSSFEDGSYESVVNQWDDRYGYKEEYDRIEVQSHTVKVNTGR